ncbi:hypothetical protein [Caballeronia grimmiae]|uniref:hypothetical protein n=1 Tax=Caballeronia grimmiae TaxID=1071679 RepID=UPI0038B8B894
MSRTEARAIDVGANMPVAPASTVFLAEHGVPITSVELERLPFIALQKIRGSIVRAVAVTSEPALTG